MKRPTNEILKKFDVFYEKDTDFAAYGRLLQSKWRVKHKFPMNKQPKLDYGNFIETEYAKSTKANFLTNNIKQLVTTEIAKAKKEKALIGEPRIWNNLLSSQPLCFNLFGELHFNLDLATKFFNQLFPKRVYKVTSVKFEYSPGRRNIKYMGDRSAFDVFVEYDNKSGKKGFIGIEVKYAESLKEETKAKANKNYKELYATRTNACGLFKPNSIDTLRMPPLAQIWRDHLLSIATKQDYNEGFFVFIFPSKNIQCQSGVDHYKTYLAKENEEQSGFYVRHLEEFINVLTKIESAAWTKELKERYLGNGE